MRIVPGLLLLLTIGGLPACGGGGGSGGVSAPHQHSIEIVPIYREAFSMLAPTDNSIASSGTDAFVGDTATNGNSRIFMMFSTAAIPAGASIVSAELSMYRVAVEGSPSNFGDLFVDHYEPEFAFLVTVPEFTDPGLADGFATLDPPPILVGPGPHRFRADVTARLQDDLAQGRGLSSFRVRYGVWTDSDFTREGQRFEAFTFGTDLDEITHLSVVYTD